MMKYGYVKVAAGVPLVRVADCHYNTVEIEQMIRRAEAQGVQLIVFPELSVTGYTCMDLFMQDCLLREAEQALLELVRRTKAVDVVCVVGMPLAVENCLLNAAVVFHRGEILGVVPKTYLPDYGEFQEMRWFTSGEDVTTRTARIGPTTCPMAPRLLFTSGSVSVGIEIGEDLRMPVPPSSVMALQGANIILNLSAGSEQTGKNDDLKMLIRQQSARCAAGYVYASAGFGESTTDLVYAGKAFIVENGTMLGESDRFSMNEKLLISEIDVSALCHDRLMKTNFSKGVSVLRCDEPLCVSFRLPEGKETALTRRIDPHPFVPSTDAACDERCNEIFHIQTNALAKRLVHTQIKHAVIGVSGGLDSTLALMATVMTFDALNLPRKQIHGVTMPGFGTTGRTYRNAVALMEALDVTMHEISIKAACQQHFTDIGHDGVTQDVTYENVQARERTQILMDLANLKNGLVIGTGDLSELALGWATYNGDHMSMYALNASIPKTLVRCLVKWVATHRVGEAARETLLDIADTPVSPELLLAAADDTNHQKTEDLIGPYELHDFFIYHLMRFGASPAKIFFLARQAFGKSYAPEEIKRWLQTFVRRFFAQQFKRNCMPDGPKVGAVSLSPRGDWRMPSDASAALWLKEVGNL